MLSIKLHGHPNPDFENGHPTGGVIPNLIPQVVTGFKSFGECVKYQQAWIKRYKLGGGNVSSTPIMSNGREVACISYNGRVWTPVKWTSRELDTDGLVCELVV